MRVFFDKKIIMVLVGNYSLFSLINVRFFLALRVTVFY
jgi:hypothetical protein